MSRMRILPIAADVWDKLHALARQRGVSMMELGSDLLRAATAHVTHVPDELPVAESLDDAHPSFAEE